METIKGKFEKSILYFYDGYTYNIDKRTARTYRCAQRRNTLCRGLAVVRSNGEVDIITKHDHLPDHLTVSKHKVKAEMLRLSRETCRTVKDIFDEVSRQYPIVAEHITFRSMKGQLNAVRRKHRPKVPNAVEELVARLEEIPPVCKFYKASVTALDGKKAVLFSDTNLLCALQMSTEIYCDGTFSVIPRSPRFSQFYTIHIRYMDTMIAVLCVLCEARTMSLYDAIWLKVIELLPGIQNNIKFIMTDYEWAAMGSLRKHFPDTKIKGCWFHFNQAVQRKWNNLKLDNAFNIILSMTMTMPLLPEEMICDAYCILKNYVEKLDSTNDKLFEFLSYIEKSWLPRTAIISVYGVPIRTNNAVESFNRVIARKLGNHPNTWVFLEKLEHLIMDQQLNLQRLHNGHKVTSTRLKKYIDRDRKIQGAQTSLISGRLPLEQFLRMFIDICKESQYRYSLVNECDGGITENLSESTNLPRSISDSQSCDFSSEPGMVSQHYQNENCLTIIVNECDGGITENLGESTNLPRSTSDSQSCDFSSEPGVVSEHYQNGHCFTIRDNDVAGTMGESVSDTDEYIALHLKFCTEPTVVLQQLSDAEIAKWTKSTRRSHRLASVCK